MPYFNVICWLLYNMFNIGCIKFCNLKYKTSVWMKKCWCFVGRKQWKHWMRKGGCIREILSGGFSPFLCSDFFRQIFSICLLVRFSVLYYFLYSERTTRAFSRWWVAFLKLRNSCDFVTWSILPHKFRLRIENDNWMTTMTMIMIMMKMSNWVIVNDNVNHDNYDQYEEAAIDN